MVIYIMEHISPAKLGEFRRFLYELKPGVYFGNISANVREHLWNKYIEPDEDVSATMIWSNANEQHFSTRIKGYPRRKIVDIDGLQLVTIQQQLNSKYILAKKNTQKDLTCHLYETAIVAEIMINEGILNNCVQRLCYFLDCSFDDLRQCICFLCGVHDIGKIHQNFQINGLQNESLSMFDIFPTGSESIRHEHFGEKFLTTWLRNNQINQSEHLSQCIYTHHQGHKYLPIPQCNSELVDIGNQIITEMYNQFCFPKDLFQGISKNTNGIFSFIASMINLCDWIASSRGTFDEVRYDDYLNREEYLDHLRDQVKLFIDKNYLRNTPVTDRLDNVNDVFKSVFHIEDKRPTQQIIFNISKNQRYPTLYLIEDSCGSGKTESAFQVASQNRANGVYMALPTAATSEAMQSRMQQLVDSGSTQLRVPVFTGQSWLSDRDITISRECWLHPARQKLFYPVAVGTVDQLILSVQSIKYGLLRLLALSGKTIIIDEMHAYDAYMLRNLEIFLQYCGWLGISVVILSATLSQRTKSRIFSAYSNIKNGDTILGESTFTYEGNWRLKSDYPLISSLQYDAKSKSILFNQYGSQPAFIKEYPFQLISMSNREKDQKTVDLAYEKIKEGGCLAIIRNTVREASNLYKQISDDGRFSDCSLLLIHGQCTIAKKEQNTDLLNRQFGKDRSIRPAKSIVVATQVIEQSLDVDFDFMISDICPIDLLIQRFGRYRRHSNSGTIRERLTTPDQIYITVPEGESFGSTEKVYYRQILQSTVDELQKLSGILHTPKDIRYLVDTVYQNQDEIFNLNSIFKANAHLLESPYKSSFEFFYLCQQNKFTPMESRLSTYETRNVAIIDKKTFDYIQSNSEKLDINVARSIAKNNTIYGVAIWKLVKNNVELFANSPHLPSGTVKGYLSDIDIYCCDDTGWVNGDGVSMKLENGELIFQ